MKIVHIITRLLRAGAEENTLATSAGQMEIGHKVVILHGPDVHLPFAQARAPGARLIEIPALVREISLRKDIAATAQIRAVLRDLRPDVVHTHQSKAGIVGRLAAAMTRTPMVIHGVHILPFLAETGTKRAFYLGAEKLAAAMTHGYVHVSEEMRDACAAHKIGKKVPHWVVHSGFDLARFTDAPMPEDWRAMLDLPEGAPKPPVIAMLASLESRKRHIALIKHLPAILAAVPKAHVVFAGEGEMRDLIASEITAQGLEGRVHLLGYRTDPERIIALADLCVLCSMREGLPRSVIQYLAGGRPALALHTEGIERVIRPGQNGAIFGTDDWAGLSAEIVALLQDDTRRAALAQGARATDLSSWNVDLMAPRTLTAYGDVAWTRGLSQLADGHYRSADAWPACIGPRRPVLTRDCGQSEFPSKETSDSSFQIGGLHE